MPQDNSAINPGHCSVALSKRPSWLIGQFASDDAVVTVPALVAFRHRRSDATRSTIGTNSGQRQSMPIFVDRSVSRPGCAAACLLRSVPVLAKHSDLSFQRFPLDDLGRYQHPSVTRAAIVLALLGLFCGSAIVMSEKPQPSPVAAAVWPPAAAQAPGQTHASIWPALPALSHD